MTTEEILRRFENQIESLNDTQDLTDYGYSMLGGLLVEVRNRLVKESDSLPCNFSKNKMWQIDGKLVVGSSVTDKEIKYYNRFFDKMVSEMQDDSNYWANHASKA